MGIEWMKFEHLKSYTSMNWMMFYGVFEFASNSTQRGGSNTTP